MVVGAGIALERIAPRCRLFRAVHGMAIASPLDGNVIAFADVQYGRDESPAPWSVQLSDHGLTS